MIRIETDNTVKDGCRVRQLRACLKGRDMRERLYSPDRLKYPVNSSILPGGAKTSIPVQQFLLSAFAKISLPAGRPAFDCCTGGLKMPCG